MLLYVKEIARGVEKVLGTVVLEIVGIKLIVRLVQIYSEKEHKEF